METIFRLLEEAPGILAQVPAVAVVFFLAFLPVIAAAVFVLKKQWPFLSFEIFGLAGVYFLYRLALREITAGSCSAAFISPGFGWMALGCFCLPLMLSSFRLKKS